MKGYIYKYTFPNGKVYIGQTRRPEDLRMREHLTEYIGAANPGFWEAYTEYGTYEYETLMEFDIADIDELVATLNAYETYFINEYKATDPNFGYNKKAVGMAVSDRNEILHSELKERHIQAKLERLPFDKMCEQILDKVYDTKEPLTDDEKAFVREFIFTNGVFDVSDYDLDEIHLLDEEELFMFEEAVDAAQWRLESEMTDQITFNVYSNQDQIVQKVREEKIIVQIGCSGEAIAEYNSFNEIAQAFGVPRADNVRNVVNGKQKSAFGYRWMYKKDFENLEPEPQQGTLF
jgi:hypothetical protein